MERRKFLHLLLGGAAVAAAPKFIFDVGAHLYKPEEQFLVVHNPAYAAAMYEEIIIMGKDPYAFFYDWKNVALPNEVFDSQVKVMYPRRFDENKYEVLPFIKI